MALQRTHDYPYALLLAVIGVGWQGREGASVSVEVEAIEAVGIEGRHAHAQ
jgi:hypothetical protein